MDSIAIVDIPLSSYHYPNAIVSITVGIVSNEPKDAMKSRALIESIVAEIANLFQEQIKINWKKIAIHYQKPTLANSRVHFIVNGSGRLLKSWRGITAKPINFYKDILAY